MATSGDGITKRPKGTACAFLRRLRQQALARHVSRLSAANSGGLLGSMYVEVEWLLDKNGGIKSLNGGANDTVGGASRRPTSAERLLC